jgi:hypothetical protein
MIRRSRVVTTLVTAVLSILANGSYVHADNREEPSDSTMVLEGGELGTAFKSLRVEGEDQIRIEFERPSLDLTVDPLSAPGLEWEGIVDVLAQGGLDLVKPFIQYSSLDRSVYFARPWLDGFACNRVARFRPAMEGVASWSLVIANSAGENVATFAGKGKPPAEITWDGRSSDGTPVPPGLTYSYVLEAVDRAGNERNIVGDGFELPAYRLETDDGMVLLFAGDELLRPAQRSGPASPILLEAASWLNQFGYDRGTIRIEAIGRSFEDAKGLADTVVKALTPLIVADPVQLQTVTTVKPNAPEGGSVVIALPK